MYLSEANLRFLIVVNIVVRGWLYTNHGILLLCKVHASRGQGCQSEVTVQIAAPSPVNIELTVLIAMQHEGVTRFIFITAIDHRSSLFYLMIEGLLPLFISKLITIHYVGTFTEVENRDQSSWNTSCISRRFVCVIIHQDRLTAITHQPGDIIIRHIEPVELTGRQCLKFQLRFALVIFVGFVTHCRAHAIQRPLVEIDYLCHRSSHTTCKCLVSTNFRTMLLVDTSLIPFSLHQRYEFRQLSTGSASGCYTFVDDFVHWTFFH